MSSRGAGGLPATAVIGHSPAPIATLAMAPFQLFILAALAISGLTEIGLVASRARFGARRGAVPRRPDTP